MIKDEIKNSHNNSNININDDAIRFERIKCNLVKSDIMDINETPRNEKQIKNNIQLDYLKFKDIHNLSDTEEKNMNETETITDSQTINDTLEVNCTDLESNLETAVKINTTRANSIYFDEIDCKNYISNSCQQNISESNLSSEDRQFIANKENENSEQFFSFKKENYKENKQSYPINADKDINSLNSRNQNLR